MNRYVDYEPSREIMADLSCILTTCAGAFLNDRTAQAVLAGFGGLAIASIFFIVRNPSVRSRIRWSYPLVFGALFVLTYFAFSMSCHEQLPLCAEHALIYSLPVALIGSLLFGYALLPNLYLAWKRAVPSPELSALLLAPVPVYLADDAKPFAFSYGGSRRWIVVSQGMVELLTRAQLQAVLLHEYGHLEGNASFYQVSRWIYGKLPLLHAFLDKHALEDEEEKRADRFAAGVQGTTRHLAAAQKKMCNYFES